VRPRANAAGDLARFDAFDRQAFRGAATAH
jgi:hypothetical protein